MLLVSAGCGEDVPRSQLVNVVAIDPGGAECAQRGGVSIQQGIDKNKNGKLDDTEVTSTQVVCEGPGTDPGSLVTITMVPEGSATCPYGGTTISTGLDNGDGGGTAGNGVLEAGEVDQSATTCSGPAPGQFDDVPPSGSPGTSRVITNGGDGVGIGSAGASAGTITIGSGPVPSSLFVFRTGQVDASFAVPTVTPVLGATPFVVSTSRSVVPLPGSPTVGEFYLGGPGIVQHTAMGDVPVTGLSVAAGATLTLGDGAWGGGGLTFTGDVSIDGTLTTAPTAAGDRPSLSFSCRQFVSGAGASIALGAASAGRSGGSFSVVAPPQPTPGVPFGVYGSIVNRANIETGGMAAAGSGSAGSSGSVSFQGFEVLNTGTIHTAGADQATGAAGSAGAVAFGCFGGRCGSSGAIDASGGDGTTAATGGAPVSFVQQIDFANAVLGFGQQGVAGAILNASTIDTSGGSITSSGCNGCNGAAGGSITFVSDNWGSPIRSSGALTAKGGSTAGSGATSGGAGAPILIRTTSTASLLDDGPTIDLGGTIDTSGGSGLSGAPGGPITLHAQRGNGALVRLLGYESIHCEGGDGANAGGAGTGLNFFGVVSSGDGTSLLRPRWLVDADLVLDGGDCSNTAGCSGGQAGSLSYQFVAAGPYLQDPNAPAGDDVRFAGISMVGGDGVSAGGANLLRINAVGRITLAGAITNRGGAALGNGGGAPGGPMWVYSAYGEVTSTGAIDVRGRDSTAASGGSGGGVFLQAQHVISSGGIDARGGSSAASVQGGAGGSIVLLSQATSTTQSGTLVATGGTGMTSGQNGVISVDGTSR